MRRRDSNSREEFLQSDTFSIWYVGQGRRVLTSFGEELEAEVDELSGLVHHASRDIDVDEPSAHRRPDGLEVASPEHNAATQVLGFTIGEE